jgi:hypothetical protein
VKDKIVLDVGSRNFDSAEVFLNYGAKKILCVERDFYEVPNFLKDKVVYYRESFNPEKHLFLDYDVCKIDIEGYEILCIPFFKAMKKTICEVHNVYMIETFLKHSWKIYFKHSNSLALMINK